jgi:hypothetical protein
VTAPADIATALCNHAEGSCCLAAAAELLIAQSWLLLSAYLSGHGSTINRNALS